MIPELPNIPFYCTAFSHWLACLLSLFFLPRRMRAGKTIAASAAFLAVMSGYMFFTEPKTGALFNLLMAGFALLTFLMVASLSETNIRQALYWTSRNYLLGGFSVSLTWQVYVYLFAEGGRGQSVAWEMLVVLPAILLVCLIWFFFEYPNRGPDRELIIPWRTALVLGAVALLMYILSSLSFATMDTPFSGRTYREAFNIRTMVYFSGLAVLQAVHMQLCESHAMRERDALESMLTMQQMSYQMEKESIELVNRKYHDLKHQIAILKSEIGTEKKLDYLDRLEKDIQVYESMNKTGNQILDTILTGKSIYCQSCGIELTCVADGEAISFMDMADISSLFGNALDNAIEAVSGIEDPGQRLIHLSVSTHKGFVRICVENRYQGKIRLKDSLPISSKPDKAFHGYGVKSIRAVAEKYSGSVNFTGKDGWFEMRVLIPIPV